MWANPPLADPPPANNKVCDDGSNKTCNTSVDCDSGVSCVENTGFCADDGTTICSVANPCASGATCREYPWPDQIQLLSSEADCGGDPNCQYLRCVYETLPLAGNLDQHNGDYDPFSSALLNSQGWCSDYGSLDSTNILYNNKSYSDIQAINGCLSRIYDTSNTVLDTSTNPPLSYNALILRPGVVGDLVGELFGSQTQQGCLVSDTPANCSLETRVLDRTTNTYFENTLAGTPCDASNYECYLQCSVVAELDAEGDKSWVKTDIWWRNQQTGERAVSDPSKAWRSYYYSLATNTFDRRADVTFDDIPSENYSFPDNYFGAAIGPINQGLVLTEAPLGNGTTNLLSAATFFEVVNSSDNIDQIQTNDNDLAVLFARVYRRFWEPNISQYGNPKPKDLYLLKPNLNPFAGGDYRPRILKVCNGDKLCDSNGQAERGITINNKTSGDIIGRDGSIFTAIKFFYYAHPDHMPVSSVDVDWGDSSAGFVTNAGKYKNSIPVCDPDSFDPLGVGKLGFGGLDRACRQGYKVFYHDYQYDPTGVYDCPFSTPQEPASCYTPKVRVTDHWGWGNDSPVVYDGQVVVYKNK